MARNVELKARVEDPSAMRRAISEVCDSGPFELVQRDVFFRTRRGRLKLRFENDEPGQLIYYDRADDAKPRVSEYWIYQSARPAELEGLLMVSNGHVSTVTKTRQLFLAGRTRIHLDQVDQLGVFVEIEVVLQADEPEADGHSEIRHVMASLGIRQEHIVSQAYVDLQRNLDVEPE